MVALISLIAGAMFLFGMSVGKNIKSPSRLNVIGVLAMVLTFSTFIITVIVPEIP